MISIKIGLYGETYLFAPQDDITPLESVRITEFFTVLTTYTRSPYGYPTNEDREEFVERHRLRRHFTRVEG